MNRIETIKARLEETQPNVITHIIKFELEEQNIISYIDDDKKKETSFLLKNKDIIEEGGLNISEIITDNILALINISFGCFPASGNLIPL